MIAAVFDEREVTDITLRLKEISEFFISPRVVTHLNPEFVLLSRLLYYGIFYVAGNGPTPGEGYCGLARVKVGQSQHQPDPARSRSSSPPPSVSVGYMSSSDLIRLYFLITILPYLHSRKDTIVDAVKTIYNELYGPLSTIDAAADVTDQQSSEFFRRLKIRMNAAATFVDDVHKCLFCLDGRYYQIPLRLSAARYVLTQQPINYAQFPLVSVGYLLAIRLGLVSATAVTNCVVSLMRRSPPQTTSQIVALSSPSSSRSGFEECAEGQISTASAVAEGNEGGELVTASLSNGGNKQETYAMCALCRETQFRSPATTTCGHVFCYQCIVSWLEPHPVCPICRHAQLPQQVRALYQYP